MDAKLDKAISEVAAAKRVVDIHRDAAKEAERRACEANERAAHARAELDRSEERLEKAAAQLTQYYPYRLDTAS